MGRISAYAVLSILVAVVSSAALRQEPDLGGESSDPAASIRISEIDDLSLMKATAILDALPRGHKWSVATSPSRPDFPIVCQMPRESFVAVGIDGKVIQYALNGTWKERGRVPTDRVPSRLIASAFDAEQGVGHILYSDCHANLVHIAIPEKGSSTHNVVSLEQGTIVDATFQDMSEFVTGGGLGIVAVLIKPRPKAQLELFYFEDPLSEDEPVSLCRCTIVPELCPSWHHGTRIVCDVDRYGVLRFAIGLPGAVVSAGVVLCGEIERGKIGAQVEPRYVGPHGKLSFEWSPTGGIGGLGIGLNFGSGCALTNDALIVSAPGSSYDGGLFRFGWDDLKRAWHRPPGRGHMYRLLRHSDRSVLVEVQEGDANMMAIWGSAGLVEIDIETGEVASRWKIAGD